jgi:hypothetical protein
MLYGNAAITTSQENVPGTWSNGYSAVYHLGTPSTLSLKNSVDGTSGTTSGAAPAAGVILGGASFNGSGDAIDCGASYYSPSTTFSCELWANISSVPHILDMLVSNTGTTDDGFQLYYYNAGYSQSMDNSGTQSMIRSQSVTGVGLGSWHHITAVLNGDPSIYANWAQYVDGAAQSGNFTTTVTMPSAASSNLTIGRLVNSTSFYTAGVICEVRISTVARTAAWALASYNNQNSPSTFMSVT